MKLVYPTVTGSLCAKMARGLSGQDAVNGMIMVFDITQCKRSANILRGGVASSLKARDFKDATDLVVNDQQRRYIVRRLTPLECCRLQGFPDWWCDGVEGSDTAQYKMWGNGIALPCAADVLGRIAKAMRDERTTEAGQQRP